MLHNFRHWHPADYRLIGLLGIILGLIAGFLGSGLQPLESTSGWRQIDLAVLQQRIDSGDLNGREAVWYHPSLPDELGVKARGSSP